jgi:hypothetical protein
MPLLRFDLIEGRSDDALKAVLDAAHRAVLAAFKVPPRDRYQVIHEHPTTRLIAEDTGLGIERSRNFVLLQVTTRPRSAEEKQEFYRLLCSELKASCGIEASDVMVSIVENTDADWSFGHGEAQFLTGRLGGPATGKRT